MPLKQITLKTKIVAALKKGDRVVIYDDPITKKRPEGTAHLVLQRSDDRELQRWVVRFEGDGPKIKHERVIAPTGNGAWEVIVS